MLSTGGNNRQSMVSLQVVLKVHKLYGSLSDRRKLFFFAVSWCCSAELWWHDLNCTSPL